MHLGLHCGVVSLILLVSSFDLAIMSTFASPGSTDIVGTLQNALKLHKAGDLKNAIVEYEKLVPHVDKVTSSVGASIHSNIGAILLQQGDYEGAKKAFLDATTVEPDNVNAHFNLAVTLTSKLGQHAQAIRHVGKVLKLQPEHVKGLHLLSNIMQSLGREEDASKYLMMAQQASRSDVDANAGNGVPAATVGPTGESSLTSKGGTGWQYRLLSRASVGKQVFIGTTGAKERPQSPETSMLCLSKEPLIFRITSLLSPEECEAIIERAKPHLATSFVTGGDQDSSKEAYRTSQNAWLSADELLERIQYRLGQLLGMTESEAMSFRAAAEELQVIKYDVGGQFKVHHDSADFHPRVLTLLIYLNDIEVSNTGRTGAGTWFPYAGQNGISHEGIDSVDDANRRALSAYANEVFEDLGIVEVPRRGNAVLFFNHVPSGAKDPLAVHAGLPVGSGEEDSMRGVSKWAANYWFRSFEPKS